MGEIDIEGRTFLSLNIMNKSLSSLWIGIGGFHVQEPCGKYSLAYHLPRNTGHYFNQVATQSMIGRGSMLLIKPMSWSVVSLSLFLSVAHACCRQSLLIRVQMWCQQCGKRAVQQACATTVEGAQRLCLHISTLTQWAQETCLWWQHLAVATVATLEPAAAVVAVVLLVVVLVVVVGLGAAAVVVGDLEGAAVVVVVGVVAVAVAVVAASFCDKCVLYV